MAESRPADGLDDYLRRVMRSARPRPTFDSPLPTTQAPQAVRLAAGPADIAIVGIPSTVALCGPHQYMDFAKSFRDVRDLFALGVPGFAGREPLPANLDVALEAQAEAVRRCSGDAPVVLAGYSAGGTFAYGVAGRLEELGAPVAGVTLIDAYSFQTLRSHTSHTDALLRRMFEEPELRVYLNATRLTAMAWYARLFMDWELREISAPTLLLRPAQPMPGMSLDGDWRSEWEHPHDAVEVPGDHWTMMTAQAASTASAVERWMTDVLGRESAA
jgi:thioesterase domain-containing protein